MPVEMVRKSTHKIRPPARRAHRGLMSRRAAETKDQAFSSPSNSSALKVSISSFSSLMTVTSSP